MCSTLLLICPGRNCLGLGTLLATDEYPKGSLFLERVTKLIEGSTLRDHRNLDDQSSEDFLEPGRDLVIFQEPHFRRKVSDDQCLLNS